MEVTHDQWIPNDITQTLGCLISNNFSYKKTKHLFKPVVSPLGA